MNRQIFEQITSRENQDNVDVLRQLATGRINLFLAELLRAMTDGMPDWKYEFILYPDNQIYLRESKKLPTDTRHAVLIKPVIAAVLGPLYLSELPEEKPEELNLNTVPDLDLAAKTKLIHHRLLRNESKIRIGGEKEDISPLMNLLTEITKLRNKVVGHKEERNIREFQNERAVIKLLDDLIENCARASKGVKISLRNGNAAAEAIENFKKYLEEYKETFSLAFNKKPISKEDRGIYSAEYLYGFDRVFMAYPGCRNRDIYSFITGDFRTLMTRGRSNFVVDSGTLKYLIGLRSSRDTVQADQAKRMSRALDNELDDIVTIVEISDDNSAENVHYTDAFAEKIKNTWESICVITDDEILLKTIYEQMENVVALYVVDSESVTPYHPEDFSAIKDGVFSESGNEKAVFNLPKEGAFVYYGNPADDLQYALKKLMGSGGEGNIYGTTLGNECFKIYHQDQITKRRQEKILKMLSLKENILDPKICWPKEALYETSNRKLLVGFSMPNVAGIASQKAISLEDLVTSLQNDDFLGWNWSRSDLVTLAMEIVQKLIILHDSDILVGDINPKNILVNNKAEVFLIDTDSYQIGDWLCPVGLPEFTSPRLWKCECRYADEPRMPEDEYFAEARLIYYILFLGGSPYPENDGMKALGGYITSGAYKYLQQSEERDNDFIWGNLSGQVKQLFAAAFAGKEECPDDRMWLNALYDMKDEIEKGSLSAEINPFDAIICEGEQWHEKSCIRCESTFMAAHNDDELCPDCRMLKKYNKAIIFRTVCPKCNKTFTCNYWDAADKEEIICPDCSGEDRSGDLTKLLDNISKNLSKRGGTI